MKGTTTGDQKQKARPIDLLSVEITSHCNFKCTFCPDPIMQRPRGHMDVDLFEKIVRELAEKPDRLPCRQVQLNLMGEPFLHPRLFDLVRIANRYEIRPVLVTNCSLLTEEWSREILELELEYIQLSYQTPTPTLFELRKSRTNIDFAEYHRRVMRFLDLKFETESSMEVWIHMLDNSQGFLKGIEMVEGKVREEQVRFFHEYAESVHRRFGVPLGSGRIDDNNYDILPGVLLYFRHCEDWGHAVRPDEIEVLPNERGVCPMPGPQLAVLWNGNTTICCLDYEGRVNLGNVKERSIEEIWYSEAMRKINSGFAEGRLCEALCQDCRGTLYDTRTGKVVSNSERPLPEKVLSFIRLYGIRKTLLRGAVELKQRIRARPSKT